MTLEEILQNILGEKWRDLLAKISIPKSFDLAKVNVESVYSVWHTNQHLDFQDMFYTSENHENHPNFLAHRRPPSLVSEKIQEKEKGRVDQKVQNDLDIAKKPAEKVRLAREKRAALKKERES